MRDSPSFGRHDFMIGSYIGLIFSLSDNIVSPSITPWSSIYSIKIL